MFGYGGAFNASSCYTLKVTAANGSFAPISHEEELAAQENLILVPNPASDHVTVFFTYHTDEVVRLKIFDQTGREVRVYNVALMDRENKFDLDLSDFAAGIYVVQLQGSTWVKNQKLVVGQ